MKPHKIAVIAGDGIGKEVMPEGIRVLDAAARKFGIDLQFDHFDWSCDYYEQARQDDAATTGGTRSAATTRSSSARSAGRRRCRTTSRSGAR